MPTTHTAPRLPSQLASALPAFSVPGVPTAAQAATHLCHPHYQMTLSPSQINQLFADEKAFKLTPQNAPPSCISGHFPPFCGNRERSLSTRAQGAAPGRPSLHHLLPTAQQGHSPPISPLRSKPYPHSPAPRAALSRAVWPHCLLPTLTRPTDHLAPHQMPSHLQELQDKGCIS